MIREARAIYESVAIPSGDPPSTISPNPASSQMSSAFPSRRNTTGGVKAAAALFDKKNGSHHSSSSSPSLTTRKPSAVNTNKTSPSSFKGVRAQGVKRKTHGTTPKRAQSGTATTELCKMSRIINVWKGVALERKTSERRRIRRSMSDKIGAQKVTVGFHPPTASQEAVARARQAIAAANKKQRALHVPDDDDDSDDDEDDVVVHEVMVDELEFDPDEAVLCMKDPNFVTIDYDEIPWYEQDYEELPWWEYPDLEEDDEVTAMVKNVIRDSVNHGSTSSFGSFNGNHSFTNKNSSGKHTDKNSIDDAHHEQQHVDRVEAIVMSFALKLKNRVAYSQQQQEQMKAAVQVEMSLDSSNSSMSSGNSRRSNSSLNNNKKSKNVIDQMIEEDTPGVKQTPFKRPSLTTPPSSSSARHTPPIVLSASNEEKMVQVRPIIYSVGNWFQRNWS